MNEPRDYEEEPGTSKVRTGVSCQTSHDLLEHDKKMTHGMTPSAAFELNFYSINKYQNLIHFLFSFSPMVHAHNDIIYLRTAYFWTSQRQSPTCFGQVQTF
jgi:hypothetical protein